MVAFYIFPTNIEKAKEQTKNRHLDPRTEKKRLLEIDEHYNKITSDEKFKKKICLIVYNNYDKESEDAIIELVKKVLNDKEN